MHYHMVILTDEQKEIINNHCGDDYYIKPIKRNYGKYPNYARVVYFDSGDLHELLILSSGTVAAHICKRGTDDGHDWEVIESE